MLYEVITYTGTVKVCIKMNRYQRDCLSAYLLVAPLVILSIVFFFFPVIYSIILGFYDWNLLNTPLFVGFQNFFELFKSDYFNETLVNTVIYSISYNFV